MHPKNSETPPAAGSLSALEVAAREQIAAAFQIHVERVCQQLTSGWQEPLERALAERFAQVQALLDSEVRWQLDSAAARGASDAADKLNQAVRRIRTAETEGERNAALLDAAVDFCSRAALFSAGPVAVRAEDARGFDSDAIRGREVPLTEAPAFASVLETRDTVVSMRSAGELSQGLLEAIGPGDGKVYLFPLASRQTVVAVLYAEAPVSAGALELLASAAASAMEARAEMPAKSSNLVALVQQIREQSRPSPNEWSELSREDRDLHLKAQRFARVQVAGMRLYKAQAVKTGRANRDLYAALRVEIDSGRDSFRRQFLNTSKTMVDYFHLELMRTLANDEVAFLGPDYPGPLVP